MASIKALCLLTGQELSDILAGDKKDKNYMNNMYRRSEPDIITENFMKTTPITYNAICKWHNRKFRKKYLPIFASVSGNKSFVENMNIMLKTNMIYRLTDKNKLMSMYLVKLNVDIIDDVRELNDRTVLKSIREEKLLGEYFKAYNIDLYGDYSKDNTLLCIDSIAPKNIIGYNKLSMLPGIRILGD